MEDQLAYAEQLCIVHYSFIEIEKYMAARGITIEEFAAEHAARQEKKIPEWYREWKSRPIPRELRQV